uniref:Reverse transcriptase domain-containing protein n=1 Tax=Bracon brevicornis TaxID=1563983 RepID=A0A6V7L4A0_9HYME
MNHRARQNNHTVIIIKKLITNTKRELERAFSDAVTNHWQNIFEKINYKDTEKFMPTINNIFRPKAKDNIKSLEIHRDKVELLRISQCDLSKIPITNDKYIITNQTDILNITGAHYQLINSPRYLNNESRLKEIVDDCISDLKIELNNDAINNTSIVAFNNNIKASNPKIENENLHHYFTNPNELTKIIKYLPNKISSGIDKIPPVVIKKINKKMIFNLAIIINNALNINYFPTSWKTALVIPILKKNKNKTDPASYRPISLTTSLSKIYEIVINKAINHQVTALNILPDNQYGFRHNHSTLHAINKFLADSNSALEHKNTIGAILIDLEKAFDSVWCDGLIYQLIKKKFPIHLVKTIYNMIKGKKFFTIESNKKSSVCFEINEGLQQGTVNSPILFSIFTAHMINSFELNSGNNTYSLAFADDRLIYVADNNLVRLHHKLQVLINKINNMYATWNLRLNPDKSEVIIIRRPFVHYSKTNKQRIQNFSIKTKNPDNGEIVAIPLKNQVTYLGVHIDELLRLSKHIDIQLENARKRFKALGRLFFNKYMNKRSKVICYLLLVRPLLTYGSPVIWNIGTHQMEIVRRFERSCLRAIFTLYRSSHSNYQRRVNNKILYNIAKIPRIDNHIIKLTRDYYNKMKSINNKEIEALTIIDDHQCIQSINSGYIKPQSFIFYDEKGYIQNENNIPILYHVRRHKKNKRIPTEDIIRGKFLYSKAIPMVDYLDFSRLKDRYWWLGQNNQIIIKLNQRARQNRAERQNFRPP